MQQNFPFCIEFGVLLLSEEKATWSKSCQEYFGIIKLNSTI